MEVIYVKKANSYKTEGMFIKSATYSRRHIGFRFFLFFFRWKFRHFWTFYKYFHCGFDRKRLCISLWFSE